MIQDAGGTVPPIVQKAGANLNYIKIKLNELVDRLPKVSGGTLSQQGISPALGRVFERSLKEAQDLKDEYISTEHLLLGLVVNPESAAGRLLQDQGVTKDAVLCVLKEIRGSQRVTDQNPEDKYQALQRYGRDLNELARKGKMDPVVGRDEEIRRVLQVLSRRTKNNPVLIGEPGVGKTAIAEGIAHRIVTGDVPESLKSRRIVALDMGSLVAGFPKAFRNKRSSYPGRHPPGLQIRVHRLLQCDARCPRQWHPRHPVPNERRIVSIAAKCDTFSSRPNNRIRLPFPGKLVQVAPVPLQCLVLVLRILICNPL